MAPIQRHPDQTKLPVKLVDAPARQTETRAQSVAAHASLLRRTVCTEICARNGHTVADVVDGVARPSDRRRKMSRLDRAQRNDRCRRELQ